MGLRFIYGRAGTGKTTYCFNEIKENINKNNKIYIITPEQFSYSAEKRLLEVLGTDATINAEVISFHRMANRIFTEVGGANNVLISKSAKAMLIHSILEKEKKNLKFLGNSKENVELVLKEITEFNSVFKRGVKHIGLWGISIMYKMRLHNLFIKIYRFMIDKLKIDIKF